MAPQVPAAEGTFDPLLGCNFHRANAVSKACALPYFGIAILVDMACVDDFATWVDCGPPDPIYIVKRLYTMSHTEDLFAAIEMKENEQVRQIFGEGQEPNCVLQHAALMHAVVGDNPSAVSTLLHAQLISFRHRPLLNSQYWRAVDYNARVGSQGGVLWQARSHEDKALIQLLTGW